MSAFDVLDRSYEYFQKQEARIVTVLLQRFEVPNKYKYRMLKESDRRFGYKLLSLDLFFEFFPTFPARLVLADTCWLPKTCTADILLNNFAESKLVDVYSRRFREYVEPGTEQMVDPSERSLLGLPRLPRLKTFGIVFRGRFGRNSGLVLHNHLIDVDVPGSRLLWISDSGQQLVLETLDVLLESIDRAAPGGEGWLPEPKPEYAIDW